MKILNSKYCKSLGCSFILPCHRYKNKIMQYPEMCKECCIFCKKKLSSGRKCSIGISEKDFEPLKILMIKKKYANK